MTEIRKNYIRPLDIKHGQVEMAHGAGGRAMAQLIDELFARYLGNEFLAQGDDGALLPATGEGRLVMATDAHVVSPLFFPGGDIGSLSVHGTLNDVAVMGAKPLWLSAAFILEEGFKLADLALIVQSMANAAKAAGVPVVTGDTKVVERGKGDGVFITTTGVGVVAPGMELSGRGARPGDAILLSGTLGDHGMAIMAVRESLGFESPIVSDSAALHGLIAAMRASGAELHVLRDPTRGGLAHRRLRLGAADHVRTADPEDRARSRVLRRRELGVEGVALDERRAPQAAELRELLVDRHRPTLRWAQGLARSVRILGSVQSIFMTGAYLPSSKMNLK